jgi:ribonuclease D
VLIVNNCQLKQFYQECQKDKYIAIDTEFYWTNTYRAIPCLIQVANSKQSILIDLISYKLDLKFIKKILFHPKLIKIFHSARQDIELLFNLFKEIPGNVSDIQLSSLAIGYKNTPSLNKLCKDFLAIYLKKENQNMDWRNRPLSKSQEDYAIKDVKYLIPLYKKINLLLSKLNRLNWVNDKHSKLLDIRYYNQKEKNAWEKVNFKPRYSSEFTLLKKISEMRERIAKRLNVPPKHLISDSQIVQICKYNDKKDNSFNFIKNQKILNKIQKIKHKEFSKEIQIIKVLTQEQKKKLQIARKILKEKSEYYNVHSSLIANRKELENMVKGNDDKLLLGWRYDVFGRYYLNSVS